MNSIEGQEGYQEVHEGEHLSCDDATHIDVTRDEFKELLDTVGEHEDVDSIEEVLAKENRDTCPSPDPMSEWFTKNTWDNIFDSSPVMQTAI